MEIMGHIVITRGFDRHERARAAALYWEAFGPKLMTCLGPTDRAIPFMCRILNPEFALSARNQAGDLVGLAGFKTSEGALADGNLDDLRHSYGWIGGVWRAALLSMLERDLEPGTLLMDGICVSAEARGLGIGSALLDGIKAEAAERGLGRVRLDVIDTNPRARALYERHGFTEVRRETIGVLRHVFGFRQSATLQCAVT